MEMALGIAVGIGTIETALLVGVAYLLVTGEIDTGWKEHRKATTDRLKKVEANGEDKTPLPVCLDVACNKRKLLTGSLARGEG